MQNAGVSFIEGRKKHEKAPTELAEEERVITTKQAMLDNCINYKKYHEGFYNQSKDIHCLFYAAGTIPPSRGGRNFC